VTSQAGWQAPGIQETAYGGIYFNLPSFSDTEVVGLPPK
jgi:hypothetical protein